MAYTKTVWTERIGTNLNKFTKSSENETSVILTNNPDVISQSGTAFTVDRMNNIEGGIDDIHNNTMTFAGAKTFSSLLTASAGVKTLNIKGSTRLLDIDLTSQSGSSSGIRLFRNEAVTGTDIAYFQIFKGDGSSIPTHQLTTNTTNSNSFLCNGEGGNLVIGGTSGSEKLTVLGTGSFSGLLTASAGLSVTGNTKLGGNVKTREYLYEAASGWPTAAGSSVTVAYTTIETATGAVDLDLNNVMILNVLVWDGTSGWIIAPNWENSVGLLVRLYSSGVYLVNAGTASYNNQKFKILFKKIEA